MDGFRPPIADKIHPGRCRSVIANDGDAGQEENIPAETDAMLDPFGKVNVQHLRGHMGFQDGGEGQGQNAMIDKDVSADFIPPIDRGLEEIAGEHPTEHQEQEEEG